MKQLNVTMQCAAIYNSCIEVPDEMSLEEAVQYAEEHKDLIPRGILEYVPASDEIDIENCDFEQ